MSTNLPPQTTPTRLVQTDDGWTIQFRVEKHLRVMPRFRVIGDDGEFTDEFAAAVDDSGFHEGRLLETIATTVWHAVLTIPDQRTILIENSDTPRAIDMRQIGYISRSLVRHWGQSHIVPSGSPAARTAR